MHDLTPAATQVASIAEGMRDDQLGADTPCADWSVAALVNHLLELSVAFSAAADKAAVPGGVQPGHELPADWRASLVERLEALARAWRSPETWRGDIEFVGATTPAESVGVVALDELVLHGWDLARATGQRCTASAEDVRTCLEFAAAMSEPGVEREGLYGPVVPFPAHGSEFDRLLCLAGRHPNWPNT